MIKKSAWYYVAAAAALMLLAGLIFAAFKVPGLLYFNNPRFTLKHLEIDSTGFWHQKERMLADRLGLQLDSNLLSLNIAKIKKDLEQINNIESAEVRIILPDMLKIRINERIPRAVLYNQNYPVVVDRHGVKMKRSESSAGIQKLPVISNLRRTMKLQPALDLIMSALNNYPDIAIQEISLENENELDVKLYYRERKACRVLFPVGTNEDYTYWLSVLQTTILRNGSAWNNFDLRYRGRVSGY